MIEPAGLVFMDGLPTAQTQISHGSKQIKLLLGLQVTKDSISIEMIWCGAQITTEWKQWSIRTSGPCIPSLILSVFLPKLQLSGTRGIAGKWDANIIRAIPGSCGWLS
jgi:hypothetical protein